MTIQTDLRNVTDRIINHRFDVARAENAVLAARHNLTVAESDLDIERRALMARSDAGTNDAQRRAYAERETAAERDRIADIAAELLDVEGTLISMRMELAQGIDRRRLLETLAQLTIAGLGEEPGDGDDDDDDQRAEDESGYNADVAQAVARYVR